MTKIYLAANDQLLAVTTTNVLASGNKNTVEVHIDFSEEWNGLTTSAVFFTKDNPTPYEMVLDLNDECDIPHEVLAKSGTLFIGVRGVDSEGVFVKASTLVKYKIKDGAPSGQGTSVAPTADVYQQIMTAYGEAKEAYGEAQDEVADIRARYEQTLKKTYKDYALLWQNSDPSLELEALTVSLGEEAMALYSEFLVTYTRNTSETEDVYYTFIKNVHECDLTPVTGVAGGTKVVLKNEVATIAGSYTTYVCYKRQVSVTEKSVAFSKCFYYEVDSTDGTLCYDNTQLIPCKIYGVRQKIATNIDEQIVEYLENTFVPTTQENYDAMVEAGTVDENKYYMIVG